MSLFAIYFKTIWESLRKRVSSMGKSNCLEIEFLKRITNAVVCTSKRGYRQRSFLLIGSRRDLDNTKLEISFLEH